MTKKKKVRNSYFFVLLVCIPCSNTCELDRKDVTLRYIKPSAKKNLHILTLPLFTYLNVLFQEDFYFLPAIAQSIVEGALDFSLLLRRRGVAFAFQTAKSSYCSRFWYIQHESPEQ